MFFFFEFSVNVRNCIPCFRHTSLKFTKFSILWPSVFGRHISHRICLHSLSLGLPKVWCDLSCRADKWGVWRYWVQVDFQGVQAGLWFRCLYIRFFESLIPRVKQLSKEKKMLLLMDVQQVVYRRLRYTANTITIFFSSRTQYLNQDIQNMPNTTKHGIIK